LCPKKRSTARIKKGVPERGAKELGRPSVFGKNNVIACGPVKPKGGSSQDGPDGPKRVEFPWKRGAEDTMNNVEMGVGAQNRRRAAEVIHY